MAKSSQLKQFGLKACTVQLRKLSESELESVESTKTAPCVNLTCEICQKKFKYKKHFERHVKYYHLVKKCQTCEICYRNFRRKNDFAKHSLTHKDKTDHPFPCSYCPKRYRSKFLLQSHVRIHLNEKPFPCTQCGLAYSSQNSLRSHTINFHNVNRGSFACDVCNRIYATLKSLQFHRKNIHDNENPTILANHKCKVCGKVFPRRYDLFCHSKIHYPDAKVFACEFCDSRFLSPAKLARHMRTHTKEKVDCNLCNKQLSTDDALRRHVRIMHCSAELANGFPCQEQNCTKKYATFTQLKQHIKKHLELWPLQCNFCNKRFQWDSHLHRHVLTHTNETPFWCTQCPKQFKTSSGWKSHIRSHSSKTPN